MTAALEIAERSIRGHEGRVVTIGGRHRAYDDATGQPIGPGSVVRGHVTIGIGRCICAANGLSEEEVDMLLANDLALAERVAAAFAGDAWRDISDVRRAALVEMSFQLGQSRLWKFSQMRLAVQALDWDVAADEAVDSKWAREDAPDRARTLAAMLRTDMEVAA